MGHLVLSVSFLLSLAVALPAPCVCPLEEHCAPSGGAICCCEKPGTTGVLAPGWAGSQDRLLAGAALPPPRDLLARWAHDRARESATPRPRGGAPVVLRL